MYVILDICGSIIGFPLLFIGYVLASISEGFTRVACWLLNIDYDSDDDKEED